MKMGRTAGADDGRTTLCAFWQSAQSACPESSGWMCITWTVVPKTSRNANRATNRMRVRGLDPRILSPNAIINLTIYQDSESTNSKDSGDWQPDSIEIVSGERVAFSSRRGLPIETQVEYEALDIGAKLACLARRCQVQLCRGLASVAQ